MSDYLASLIARNMEVADRVQPRAVSTFEPMRGQQPGERASLDPTRLDQLEEHVFVEVDDPPTRGSAPARRPAPPSEERPATREAREEIVSAPAVPPTQAEPSRARPSRARPEMIRPIAVAPDRPSQTREGSPTPSAPAPDLPSATLVTSRLSKAPASRTSTSAPAEIARPHRRQDKAAPPTATRQPTAGRRHKTPEREETTRVIIETPLRSDIVTEVVSAPPSHVDRRRGTEPPTWSRDDAARVHPAATHPRSSDGSSERTADVRPPAIATLSETPFELHLPGPPRGVTTHASQALKPADTARSAFPAQVRVRQAPARDMSSQPSPASEGPSTIHVTIGRIEVRATPETSRTKEKSSAPASGLDEYLRRRAEGNGR